MKVARGEVVRIWTLYDFSTTPYLYYLTHLFHYALGRPLEVAALLGILLVVWRKERKGWVLLSFLLPYFLLVGGLHTKPIRYATPLLPLLSVLGAWGGVEAGRWLYRVVGRWPVAALPVVLVGVPTVGYGLSVAGIYGEEDSRVAAAAWVREHIPEGACVLAESGGFPTAWMVPEGRYRRKLDKATFFLDAEGCFFTGTRWNF